MYVCDESKVPVSVPVGHILRVVAAELEQRQDKTNNPHGEHAHDVWRISL
jgi:hypothetical protein